MSVSDIAQCQKQLKVKRLDQSEFLTLSSAWEDLLSRSGANPLFMGWPWLYSWWEEWGISLNFELALFGAYEESGRLVGLAPFYLYTFRSPLGFRIRRLHLIGNAWRILPTVRTEYAGLIIERGMEEAVTNCLLEALASLNWQEVIVSDITQSEMARWQGAMTQIQIKTKTVTRVTDRGVRIDVTGDYQHWVKSLGRNTRLKLFNRRFYLRELGALTCRKISLDHIVGFMKDLNSFHEKRWGKPCFDQAALRFHSRMIYRLSDSQLHLTKLEWEGRTVSVLYDLSAGSYRYNIQSGYEEYFDPKVALGTMHLGFAIEDAFASRRVAKYDLLAGHGKKSFYKSHFKGDETVFLTVQFVRHPLMRFIYSCQSLLPGYMRRLLNRLVKL